MTATVDNVNILEKKHLHKIDYLILIFGFLFTVTVLVPYFIGNAYADTSNIRSLTDMFRTQTFRGSAEALSKSNFISMILHYVISWFSFIGLCLTLYQKFITLLYLSSRNLFDTIYDIKTQKMKGGFLGYKDLFSSLMQGENDTRGGGIDVFITFGYSLLPNVKAYCDYCPDKLQINKLEETDGVTQYMLKTSIPTIMLVFFLTIGYSGTLAMAYGTIVDGMAVAADNLVNRNLAGYVKRLVGEGGGYAFSLSASGTSGGAFAQKVAEQMYHQILGLCNNTSIDFQQNLGRIIEETVAGTGNGVAPSTDIGVSSILGGTATGYETLAILASKTQATTYSSETSDSSVFQESDIENLKSPYVYISINKDIVGDAGLSYRINDILLAAGATEEIVSKVPLDRYIHILVYKNTQSNVNYQIVQDEEMTIE